MHQSFSCCISRQFRTIKFVFHHLSASCYERRSSCRNRHAFVRNVQSETTVCPREYATIQQKNTPWQTYTYRVLIRACSTSSPHFQWTLENERKQIRSWSINIGVCLFARREMTTAVRLSQAIPYPGASSHSQTRARENKLRGSLTSGLSKQLWELAHLSHDTFEVREWRVGAVETNKRGGGVVSYHL